MVGKTLTITVLVKTKAKCSVLEWDSDLNCYVAQVKSQPIRGRANKELLIVINKFFDAESTVLIKGVTSKTKVFKVEGAMKNLPDKS